MSPWTRALAQDVLDNPDEWVMEAALIWRRKPDIPILRVTDQAVDAVRRERERNAVMEL